MNRILMSLLMCVLVLTVPDAVQAAGGGGRGGGGGGGGGRGGIGGGGGRGGEGFGRGGYGGGYGRGYYGGGFYGYGYGGIYLGYPGYDYGYGYADPYYAPSVLIAPSPYLAPTAPRPGYPQGDDPSLLPAAAPNGNTANIRVILPDPNAKLLVDGSATKSTGGTRLLETPDLKPGESYHYDLTATWEEGTRTITEKRRVEVTAGGVSTVDFTRPAPKP